jgi:hypothetical protein
MGSQSVDHQHPVAGFAQRLHARLDSLVDVPLWSMSPGEKREALLDLGQCAAQLDLLRLRLLAEAEESDATVESGARSAADWLAIESRQIRRDARSDLQLAEKLGTHPVLSTAIGDVRVNIAQARAMVAALDRLPRTGEFAVSDEQRITAEEHLIELAAHHDAKELRVLGRHLFEVIAPELAETFEGRALEQEEANAVRRTTFTMWDDDKGTCHGRFRVPSLHGQMIEKMILAISSPGCGIDSDLPTPVRHGIAFTQLIESVPPSDLPKTGG